MQPQHCTSSNINFLRVGVGEGTTVAIIATMYDSIFTFYLNKIHAVVITNCKSES